VSTKARVSFKDRLRSRSHYLQISVVRKSQGRSHHLGYSPGADKPGDSANHRNGVSGKTVLTDDGPLRIEVPRDRVGSFEPVLIPKHERRFTGFDDKIVAMYARGMTVREIQGFLAEQYGTEVVLIPKHERRFTGFDDKIVAMYARGMTVREIQGFLAEQ